MCVFGVSGCCCKNKTAYEMLIRDWSSYVCSSDLLRFDAAANTIYHFVWDRFCDWYLELIKGQIDEEAKDVAGWVLDQILVMLHPFMPFVTEELWHAMRSEESSVGKECVSPCRVRWSAAH